ncbi:MAG: hypothetical protein CMI16_07085 [Opitutaceae bacterium]|nr:hypothetical protein [Opitutaceae bacterium]
MRGFLLVCFCATASCVLLQPFLKKAYSDFFGYLTNSIIYFVHLPFVTVVLLSEVGRVPTSVLAYFPVVVATSVGVWVGVQCMLLLQTNEATYALLTMKESVPLGVGVVYNEIVHTLPVATYALVYMTDGEAVRAAVAPRWQYVDLLGPLAITALFATLNPNIDTFYKLNRTAVWLVGCASLVATLLAAAAVRRALNKKADI